jgi:hypothetical protein
MVERRIAGVPVKIIHPTPGKNQAVAHWCGGDGDLSSFQLGTKSVRVPHNGLDYERWWTVVVV